MHVRRQTQRRDLIYLYPQRFCFSITADHRDAGAPNGWRQGRGLLGTQDECSNSKKRFFLPGMDKLPIRTKDFQVGRREANQYIFLSNVSRRRGPPASVEALLSVLSETLPLRFSRNARESLQWERVTQAAVNLWPLYIHLLYNHSNPKQHLESKASPAAMFTLDH